MLRPVAITIAALALGALPTLAVPDMAASQTYQGCDEVANQSPAERQTCEEEAWITAAEGTPTESCQDRGDGLPLEEAWCKQAEARVKAAEEAAKENEEKQVIAKAEVEAKEANEQQKAEEAAIKAIKSIPLKHLVVKVHRHYESAHGNYGHVWLEITAAPYAYVTVRLHRHGHRVEHYALGDSAHVRVSVLFSCGQSEGSFHYTVSAHTDEGKTLVREGEFQTISHAQCAVLRAGEEYRDRAEKEELKRYEEAQQHEAAQHLHEWEVNCRAENGTPRTLNTGEGPERYCVAPGGGFLSVPEP